MRKSFLTFLFFLSKLALSTALVYLAYYIPGKQKTTLSVMDYMIDLETGRLVAGIFVLVIGGYYLWKLIRYLISLPKRTRAYLTERRLTKAKENSWDSFIALASGESHLAFELAQQAHYQDPSNVFAQVMVAQASLKRGEDQETEKKFQSLLTFPNTRFLGLQGLIQLKQKQNRWGEVYSLLEDALAHRPQSLWALNQLLLLSIQEGNLDKASELIQRQREEKGISKEKERYQQGIILYLKAKKELASVPSGYSSKDATLGLWDKIEDLLESALKKAPTLTPASLELAQLYIHTRRLSKAQACLMKGYAAQPHRDYLAILNLMQTNKSGQPITPLERYQFAEEMASSHPQIPQTHIILATLALEAKLWGQARLHLNFLKEKQATKSYYQLMNRLETLESPGQTEKAKMILEEGLKAPADPQWQCGTCHTPTPQWAALCPHCHTFDSISL